MKKFTCHLYKYISTHTTNEQHWELMKFTLPAHKAAKQSLTLGEVMKFVYIRPNKRRWCCQMSTLSLIIIPGSRRIHSNLHSSNELTREGRLNKRINQKQTLRFRIQLRFKWVNIFEVIRISGKEWTRTYMKSFYMNINEKLALDEA